MPRKIILSVPYLFWALTSGIGTLEWWSRPIFCQSRNLVLMHSSHVSLEVGTKVEALVANTALEPAYMLAITMLS